MCHLHSISRTFVILTHTFSSSTHPCIQRSIHPSQMTQSLSPHIFQQHYRTALSHFLSLICHSARQLSFRTPLLRRQLANLFPPLTISWSSQPVYLLPPNHVRLIQAPQCHSRRRRSRLRAICSVRCMRRLACKRAMWFDL